MHPTQLLVETLRLGGAVPPERLRAGWRAPAAPGLERLVEFEGCALWLHRRFVQIDAAGVGGGRFRSWLAREARGVAARNLLVDAQAADVARLLAGHDVPHVLLKGVARRALAARLPFADARATHDVDVLVPAGRAMEAWQRLRAAGYEPVGRGRPGPRHFHLPPLWNSARVAVELHTSTGPLVTPAEAWRRSTAGGCELERDGVRLRVPGATELLWHGLTHALRHDVATFRLRFLLDGAAILGAGVPLDWDKIDRRLASAEGAPRVVSRAWLVVAAWLAGATLPPALEGGEPNFDLARALRWRSAVLRLVPPQSRLAAVLGAAAARVELGQEWGYVRRSPSTLHRAVQRVRAVAARAAYRAWRAAAVSGAREVIAPLEYRAALPR